MSSRQNDDIRYKTYFCETEEQCNALFTEEAYQRMMTLEGSIAMGPMASGNGYYYREEFPSLACSVCRVCPCLTEEVDPFIEQILNSKKDGESVSIIRSRIISACIRNLH